MTNRYRAHWTKGLHGSHLHKRSGVIEMIWPPRVTACRYWIVTKPLEDGALEHLRHQRRNRGPFGPVQRDVREQRVALEALHDGHHTVVTTHPQVVALRDVVGEHDLGVR